MFEDRQSFRPETPEEMKYRRYLSGFMIKNQLLTRKKIIGGCDDYSVVLPSSERKDVLYMLHDQLGHPGRDKTLAMVKRRFFWPGMTKDVEDYVKSCHRCIVHKTPVPTQQASLVPITSSEPLELLCLDYLTLEPSTGGIENILVITNHFSKFSVAVPTRNQTAM